MRFLRKEIVKKTVLVISDLHLSAGTFHQGNRNQLEDFHYDQELIEFLEYYSSNEYLNRDVELVINGDFLDFLAVPYVSVFDDEYWSEKASLQRLNIIKQAHAEVFEALDRFLQCKRKKVVYIIGNHDAELALPEVRQMFMTFFSESSRACLEILHEGNDEYYPLPEILIKHGHQYEIANNFTKKESLIVDEGGERYFMPPWGSYYVTRVVNKFKKERAYVNQVRPPGKFLINGLIYDPVFTLRFIFANIAYFIMVRLIFMFKSEKNFKTLLKYIKSELSLFLDYEKITENFLKERADLKAMIVGHTHIPSFRPYWNGPIFINTGTWTRIYRMDFAPHPEGVLLTYAQIDMVEDGKQKTRHQIDLNIWRGKNDHPFVEFA